MVKIIYPLTNATVFLFFYAPLYQSVPRFCQYIKVSLSNILKVITKIPGFTSTVASIVTYKCFSLEQERLVYPTVHVALHVKPGRLEPADRLLVTLQSLLPL